MLSYAMTFFETWKLCAFGIHAIFFFYPFLFLGKVEEFSWPISSTTPTPLSPDPFSPSSLAIDFSSFFKDRIFAPQRLGRWKKGKG